MSTGSGMAKPKLVADSPATSVCDPETRLLGAQMSPMRVHKERH
jgi:hypothetical protein